MKRIIMLVMVLGMMLVPLIAVAETRTYTETVTVKVGDDEYSALNKAKDRGRENSA
ncbi:MAG: hypothetical protein WCI45_06460 [Desulfuromonadales bacterium]